MISARISEYCNKSYKGKSIIHVSVNIALQGSCHRCLAKLPYSNIHSSLKTSLSATSWGGTYMNGCRTKLRNKQLNPHCWTLLPVTQKHLCGSRFQKPHHHSMRRTRSAAEPRIENIASAPHWSGGRESHVFTSLQFSRGASKHHGGWFQVSKLLHSVNYMCRLFLNYLTY